MRILVAICFGIACSLAHLYAQSIEDPVPMVSCNSKEADYAPAYDPRTRMLVFTSERSGKAGLYRCGAQTDGNAEPIGGTFVEGSSQRGMITFAAGGEAYGVCYSVYEQQSFAGIVSVPRDDAAFNLGKPIESINGPFFVSHPAVSPDGTRMVICTNRPGGEGGLDLWVSDRRDDLTWSDPTTLGRIVNSSGDEISPHFITSDSLYFASNGIGGKGGFDVFYSVYRDGAWQEPVPMDALNTEFDESDCARLEDGSYVFASNRPGGAGGLDLWISRKMRE